MFKNSTPAVVVNGLFTVFDFFQDTVSKDQSNMRGDYEFERYKRGTEGIAEIFEGDKTPIEKEFNLENGNFNDLYGDNINKNIITGNNEKNILQALAGNENELYGGKDDDTYIYSKGDGQDIIIEELKPNPSSWQENGNDTLELRNINRNDVNIYQKNRDLIIDIKDDGGSITVKNYFEDDGVVRQSTLDNIKFANTNTLKISELGIYHGSDEDNTYTGNRQIIFGNDGSDKLYGTEKNDTIYGDDFSNTYENVDYLYGNGGNDTLYGGTGEDTLLGQSGDDTYVINSGDGVTIITDESGNDPLQLDVNYDDVNIFKDLNYPTRLKIVSSEHGIDITIKNYFDSSGFFGGKSIDLIKFRNGDLQNLSKCYREKFGASEVVDYTKVNE